MANLNYSQYDFDSLRTQLISRLQNSAAWRDIYRSATGTMLIEVMAYVGDLLMYYLERQAEESYIDTARNRSSVINLLRLLNYNPSRNISAAGLLTFYIDTPYSKNIYIPQYTECQTAGKVKYVTIEDAVILAGQTSINVNAVQGQKIEIEVTSDGSLNWSYNVNDIYMENTRYYVYVDDIEWTAVTSFINSQPEDKHFRIRTELNSTVSIIMGNNVKGAAPVAGSIVRIRYIKSDGSSGNVYSTGAITTVNSTIYDIDAAIQDVKVTNNVEFIGGDDIQSIEEMRYEGPRVFSTGDRAITREDYIAILEGYGGVENANVWGENEEVSPDPTLFNLVRICVLLDNWADPNAAFKALLTDYLETKAQITVRYEYITATQLWIMPVVTIVAERGYTLSQVQSNVEEALSNQFLLGTTAKIGVAKRIAELYSAVEAAEGVSYTRMTLDVRKTMTMSYVITPTTYAYGETLEAVPITHGSARLYASSTLLATDNGAGGWTAEPTWTVTGVIDYTTGKMGVNITPAPSTTPFVRYNQEASGDIDVTKSQICRLHSVSVPSITYVP